MGAPGLRRMHFSAGGGFRVPLDATTIRLCNEASAAFRRQARID